MASYKFGQYTLTKPLTLSGEAYYWTVLVALNQGIVYTLDRVRNRDFKYFTFQALREAKLIVSEKGEYKITTRGQAYITYYSLNDNPQESFFDRNPITAETVIITKEEKELKEKSVSTPTIEKIVSIPTTSNEYKIEVQRTNGASIYCEKYNFSTPEDRELAINVLNRAVNTTAKEI